MKYFCQISYQNYHSIHQQSYSLLITLIKSKYTDAYNLGAIYLEEEYNGIILKVQLASLISIIDMVFEKYTFGKIGNAGIANIMMDSI